MMEPEMKTQIVDVVDKILSNILLVQTKVSELNERVDPIKGSEILAQLEEVKDMVEELSQMELVDGKPEVEIPKNVSVVPVSTSISSTTTPMKSTSNINSQFNHLVLDEFDEFDDNETADYDYDDDDDSAQGWACSIRDICDYDSDTGICEY